MLFMTTTTTTIYDVRMIVVMTDTLLLLPSFVANGRPQVHLFARVERAPVGAEQHAQARLLQDLHVVVVGVAHGPAGRVPPRFFAVGTVDEAHVTVHPVVERVVPVHLFFFRNSNIIIFRFYFLYTSMNE